MPTKFYFRDTASAEASPTAEQSTTMPAGTSNTNLPWLLNKMLTTAGSAQTSKTITALAQSTRQSGFMVAFASDPLAAQTIAAASWTAAFAASESNTNANAFAYWMLYVWRPGTSSLVGAIFDVDVAAHLTEWVLTTETGSVSSTRITVANGVTAVTCQDGDILICECWHSATQGMATAYTGSFFYSGATDPLDATGTTDAASYLSNPNTITFYTAPTANPRPIRVVRQAVGRSAVR